MAHSDSNKGEPRLRRWFIRWRPAAPVLLLFAIGVGAVFGLTYLGGVGLDREAAQTSLMEVSTQIADRTKDLESVARDYALVGRGRAKSRAEFLAGLGKSKSGAADDFRELSGSGRDPGHRWRQSRPLWFHRAA